MKKKHWIIIISLSSAFVLLLTLALLGKFVWGWFDEQKEEYVPPVKEEGEAYFYIGNTEIRDTVLIFPQLERSDMFHIRVQNTSGDTYFFQQVIGKTNYFTLGKYVFEEDENGKVTESLQYYNPSISGQIQDFDYSTLYDATTKISTLINASGIVVVSERIKPTANDIKDGLMTQEFLGRYGLSTADKPASITVVPYAWDLRDNGQYYYTYEVSAGEEAPVLRLDNGKYYYVRGDADVEADVSELVEYRGTKAVHPMADASNAYTLYVGNKTVDDNAYYLYLEGRNVVYTTTANYMEDVVERGLGYYVAPRLVTAAETDSSHIMTPGFSIENGQFVDTLGAPVPEKAQVGLTAEKLVTWDSDDGIADKDRTDVFVQIDTTKEEYAPFAEALVGKHVGDKVDIIVPMEALALGGSIVTYQIDRVAGVYRDGKLIETEGTALTDDDKIVISYSDGTIDADDKVVTFMGLVDLKTAPDKLKALFVDSANGNKRVGDAIDMPLMVTYDGYNNKVYTLSYEIESIDVVYDAEGKEMVAEDGETVKVTYGCTVVITINSYEDGEAVLKKSALAVIIPPEGTEEGQFDNHKTWLGEVEPGYEQDAEKNAYISKKLATALIGAKLGTCVDDDKKPAPIKVDFGFAEEYISDFLLYKNTNIDNTVSYTENLSFAFANDRDIFYGDSNYVIETADKSMYSLDFDTTNEVIGLFGDLTGDETVAVGLNAETMKKYGLYQYRVVYEMPYGIDSEEDGDKTYWTYKTKIAYTLYVSAKQEDGSRYIATDQYDIVVKLNDGSTFDFVDWSFYTKWMQNSIVSFTYRDLRRLVFDLNFTDGGDYDRVWAFDVTVDPEYKYQNGTNTSTGQPSYATTVRLYAALANVGKDLGATNGNMSYAALNALMPYLPERTIDLKNELSENTLAGKFFYTISDSIGKVKELEAETFTDLDAIYGNKYAEGDRVNMLGAANMQNMILLLRLMRYWGEVETDMKPKVEAELAAEGYSKTEIAAMIDTAVENKIATLMAGEYSMRMALTLWDSSENKECGYTLTFYNYDGHALVSLHDEQTGKSSALFFVQAREVRRLAQAVVALGTGVELDLEDY